MFLVWSPEWSILFLGLGVHLLLCLLLFLWQLHFLFGSLLLHHFCSYFFLSICILWCWFVGSCPALFLLLMLCWLLLFLGVILCSLFCFWLCFASFSKPVAPQSTERSASCHHQTVATDLHMSYENSQPSGRSKCQPQRQLASRVYAQPSCNSYMPWKMDRHTVMMKAIIEVCYMDFMKAFDKIIHKHLLAKVKSYGMKGNILN